MGWRDRKWRVTSLALNSGISQEQIFEMWNRIYTRARLGILFKSGWIKRVRIHSDGHYG